MASPSLTEPSASSDRPYDESLIRRWLIILILLGILWRLVRFGLAMPIWGDEAMLGLNVIDRSYRQLLQPLNDLQVAPFGFLWLLRFTFDRLGVSDLTTRLPTCLASIAALLLLWEWAKLLVSRQAAFVATGVTAVSVYIVRHGVEMKPYAMDFLAALFLLFVATQFLFSKKPIWLIASIFALPFCIGISYPAIFTASGIAIAFLVDSRRQEKTCRILSIFYCLVLTGSFLAIFKLSAQGQYRETAGNMIKYFWSHAFPPVNPLKFILWFVQIHTGNLFAYPLGGKNGASLATTILFGLGVSAMWRKWQTPVRVTVFLPFLLTFIAAVLRLYPYGDSARVSQHLAPVIILATGAGASFLIDAARSRRERRIRLHIAGCLLLAIGIIGLGRDIIRPYKTKTDEQVRSNLRRLISTAGNDPILVLQPESQVPSNIRWYLRERPIGVGYGAATGANALKDASTAWLISCIGANDKLAVALATEAQMDSSVWLRQDLATDPRQKGRNRLEILHLVRWQKVAAASEK